LQQFYCHFSPEYHIIPWTTFNRKRKHWNLSSFSDS
jgi:hypothetical protein